MNTIRSEFYRNYRLARIAITELAMEYREWVHGMRDFPSVYSTQQALDDVGSYSVNEEAFGIYGSAIAEKMEAHGATVWITHNDGVSYFFEPNSIVVNAVRSALGSPAQDRASRAYTSPM